MILFPIVFFAVNGFLSDWNSYDWYLYPLVLAYLPSAALLMREVVVRLPVRIVSVVVPTMLVAACSIVTVTGIRFVAGNTVAFTPAPWSRYAPARMLADFARQHPGNYAMGDNAGLVSFMTRQPLLQLEGLVADNTFLEHIRRGDDLHTLLCKYDIDYLIVSSYYPLVYSRGCYHVTAPTVRSAGERSRKMEGDFCTPPLFYQSRGGWYTYVFAVNDCK
jgi:hypothetical protein